MKIFKRFIAAFAFLSICPIPRGIELDKEDIGRSNAFFPIVGIVMGIVYAVIAVLFLNTPYIAAVALVVMGAILTRSLHLDGVADLADALGGGYSRRRKLEILRDSRIGTFGTVAVVLVLLVKFAAISTYLDMNNGGKVVPLILMIVVPAVVGRWVMVWLLSFFPYARSSGKGKAFDKNRNPADVWIAGFIALITCFLCGGPGGVIILVSATVLIHLFGIAVGKKLGGLTGDVYGAACELTEAMCFVVIVFLPAIFSLSDLMHH